MKWTRTRKWIAAASATSNDRHGNRDHLQTAGQPLVHQPHVDLDETSSSHECAPIGEDILLREYRHRVKNHLQLIVSLLSMQARQIQNDEIRQLFNECKTRVRAIALIHDMLFRPAQRHGFDLECYLIELVQNILRCYSAHVGTVRPKIVTKTVDLKPDMILPCCLIINELVCNCLKHAFANRRSGEIRVELSQQNDHVILIVADDGVGIPCGESPGNGVGKQIVQALVDQLSGNIEWVIGQGTSAMVTFPITKGAGGNSHVSNSNSCG